MVPDVLNLQRKIQIDIAPVRTFAQSLSASVTEAAGFTFAVAIVSDARIRELNTLFRDKDTPTDVLSFPYSAEPFEPEMRNLGDIVISAETAQRQAEENGLTLEGEIKQLILHGVLHLCGYDHETDSGEMNARELELREELGI